jgi:hypothetical protein
MWCEAKGWGLTRAPCILLKGRLGIGGLSQFGLGVGLTSDVEGDRRGRDRCHVSHQTRHRRLAPERRYWASCILLVQMQQRQTDDSTTQFRSVACDSRVHTCLPRPQKCANALYDPPGESCSKQSEILLENVATLAADVEKFLARLATRCGPGLQLGFSPFPFPRCAAATGKRQPRGDCKPDSCACFLAARQESSSATGIPQK